MVKKYIPDHGDVVYVSFDPTRGHEQAGTRPAVVVSSTHFSLRTGFFICCPITSRRKGYGFEVSVSGNTISGIILCDQLRTLDFNMRKPRFIEKLDDETLRIMKGIVISIIE